MNQEQFWEKFRSFTDARIGIGRTGGSLTTKEMLLFRKDHALAKDAVWMDLDTEKLSAQLDELKLPNLFLKSQAENREAYIQRPDWGRVLRPESVALLESLPIVEYDVSISIADGLSALAIERHAIPFLTAFFPMISSFHLAPISIVQQGRVAISDQIGQLLNAQISIILIGERPGLSSPDSLGIYMTYQPQEGNTDEKRNCISNIRTEGLPYKFAAQKLHFLLNEAIRRQLSGVNLKDTFEGRSIE